MYHLETVTVFPDGIDQAALTTSLPRYQAYLASLQSRGSELPPITGLSTVVEVAQTAAREVFKQKDLNGGVLQQLGRHAATILTSEAMSLAGLEDHLIYSVNGKSGVAVPARASAADTSRPELYLFSGRGSKHPGNATAEGLPLTDVLVTRRTIQHIGQSVAKMGHNAVNVRSPEHSASPEWTPQTTLMSLYTATRGRVALLPQSGATAMPGQPASVPAHHMSAAGFQA
jgi:hypothetical protein